MIDTLLFDLDNTLLDFDKAEANAITRALGDVGISVTDEMRDHFLWRSFVYILALTTERFNKCRTADMQIHVFRFMTICTPHRVYYLTTQCRPFLTVERIYTDRLHQSGDIRAFACPARRGLRTVSRFHGRTGTERMDGIIQCIHMSARSGIIF